MSKLEQAINCSDGDQVAKAIQDARRHGKSLSPAVTFDVIADARLVRIGRNTSFGRVSCSAPPTSGRSAWKPAPIRCCDPQATPEPAQPMVIAIRLFIPAASS